MSEQVDTDRGYRLLLALMQLQAEADELAGLFPSWVELEPVPLREPLVCSWYSCGEHADYVVLGPDYPYCKQHLRLAASGSERYV